MGPARPARKDAARNRERLLTAARALFAEQGHDVPLDDVARAAEVSRATLYRHFASREELAATIYAAGIARVEQRAAALAGDPDGARKLFAYVLDLQRRTRTIVPVLSRADTDGFADLARRTAAAFRPLVTAGKQAGAIHPAVGLTDVLLAIQMAETAPPRAHAILLRGLFTGA